MIFPAVSSYQDQGTTPVGYLLEERSGNRFYPAGSWLTLDYTKSMFQGIDHRRTGNPDILVLNTFVEQVRPSNHCCCKVISGKPGYELPIDFFRERRREIARPQACFDVTYRNVGKARGNRTG